MNENISSQRAILEQQIQVLTEENARLADRAEDSLLLGLISKSIENPYDKFELFSSGVEQISILKGIPFCSCGQLMGNKIERITSYVSFSDSLNFGYPIELRSEVLADLQNGPVIVSDIQNIQYSFGGSDFRPKNIALVPFKAHRLPDGIFVFMDDTSEEEYFASMLILLNQAVDLIVSKYNNISLLEALQKANRELEQRVKRRTHELTLANEAIQKSEYKYRQLIDNASDAIFVVQNGRLAFFNNKTIQDLRYSREELSNLPLMQLIHPDCKDLIQAFYDKRIAGDTSPPDTYTVTALTKDRSEIIVAISSVLVDWNGKPATLNFAKDISEQRKIEEKLHQSQKMEAIGQLASGIAHDFNNMLGGIMGAAEMLGFYLPDDSKARKFHLIILEAANRAAGLTRKLLSFSRSSQQVSTPVKVHNILEEAIVLLENSIDPRIKIQPILKATSSTVCGDPSLLQNVFINLGINASQAMPDGGTIFFSSENTVLDSLFCRHSTFNIKPGNYLELEIRDTGVGILPEHLGKIFEPFFTTKTQGQGTGLGLASVYGTIQQHGGAIKVYSEVGAGTTFHLLLPLADKTATQQAAIPHLYKGKGHILVVDDEEVMRLTAEAILQELGYDVTVASDGHEGLEKYKQQGAVYDLVLLDMVMPVMNGRDCFEAMKKLNPHVRVVLSSGFSREEDLQEMKANGLLGLVRKPYRSTTLSKAIHDALMQN
jgi:PAS domain S-box-containing protein